MWISERLDAKRTLILVPSLSLLAQTLREWSANATKPFDYLTVCSDETVAGEDDFVLQVQRWLGHHSPAFTLATYIHLIPGDEAEALDLTAELSGNRVATPLPSPEVLERETLPGKMALQSQSRSSASPSVHA